MFFKFGETITVHRFSGEQANGHGKVKKLFTDEQLGHVAVEPYQVAEPSDGGREQITTRFSIYLSPGAGITPLDEVTVRGVRCEVDGAVSGEWVNPFNGWAPGSEVRLKEVAG
ncbi:hypothetical protein [Glutamicibacter halophytocola]|uniref:Uncharacterized protein n=1 Tax=Glutamicibacter halophytocola TaxID=1933880 RepID=A0AA94XTH4_9MICC|nr:hypothetical protein [Glutamicibacter halophytocola]UUX60171.1 hypothetical protein NUH22_06045 [Glutamicibacter halophytocola]